MISDGVPPPGAFSSGSFSRRLKKKGPAIGWGEIPPAGANDVHKLQLRDNVIGWQTSYELEKAMRESR